MSALKIFILEDNLERIKQFRLSLLGNDLTIAKDIDEADQEFKPPYDVFFLDHDLGDRAFVETSDPNTGSAFLREKRVRKALAGKVVIIHSLNIPAAKSMAQTCLDAGAQVQMIPFPTLMKRLKDLGF